MSEDSLGPVIRVLFRGATAGSAAPHSGQAGLPYIGDEIHHFGWNACSSALCPYAPHPQRRVRLPGGLAGHEHGHAVLGSLLSGALGDGAAGVPGLLVAAVAVHTLSMLAVAGAVALIVYERLGLQLLRRAWINLDWVWSLALIVSGIALSFWA